MPSKGRIITKTITKQDLGCDDIRKIFFANIFDLPGGIEPSPALPKGYYSFVDEALKKSGFLSKTEENNENYIVAIDMESKIKPEKFFRNMTRFCEHFDDECKIQCIMVQKAGLKNAKKTLCLKPVETFEMRMIICIVDETTPYHTHLEIVSSGKKVQVVNKTSYSTSVFSNSSQINISISDEKENSKMKLAEAYYIIIDFEPSPSFNEYALGKVIMNHPMSPKKIAKKISKDASSLKEKFGGDGIEAIQKLISSMSGGTKKEEKNFTVSEDVNTEDFEATENDA